MQPQQRVDREEAPSAIDEEGGSPSERVAEAAPAEAQAQEQQAPMPLDELLRGCFDRLFDALSSGSQDLGKITEELNRAGKRARSGTEEQIRERPLGAILLFFFLGILFGRVSRRGA